MILVRYRNTGPQEAKRCAVTEEHQLKLLKRFPVDSNFVNMAWENITENIKISSVHVL